MVELLQQQQELQHKLRRANILDDDRDAQDKWRKVRQVLLFLANVISSVCAKEDPCMWWNMKIV
jgi:hypothetical protein